MIKVAIEKLGAAERLELAEWLRGYTHATQNAAEKHGLAGRSTNQQKGDKAEAYVANLIAGAMMPPRSPYDITAPNGVRLEVKYSSLSGPRGGSGTVRNWTWARPLGANRDKSFDQLILVAEPNDRVRTLYKEPSCQYVLFDVSSEELHAIMDIKNNQIALNSDPSIIWRSKAKLRRLYELQVTQQQLRERYKGL